MKFSRLTRYIAPLTLSLCLSAPVMAEDVKLGRNANATEQAVAALILADIYKRAGLNAKVQPMPAARANAAAVAGQKHGEVGRIQAYVDNNPSLIQVKPHYYFITTTGFAKDSKNISISTRADLAGYKVGEIRGVAYTKAATEGHPATQVVSDADQLYKMLAAGRIDIALDAGINGPYMLEKLGIKGVSAVGDLAKLELFAILHPSRIDIEPKIAAAVQSLIDSNELDAVIKKHEKAFLASGAPN